MLTLLTGILCFLAMQDDAAAQDFTKDFTNLCRRFAEAGSYSFMASTEEEGGRMGMGRSGSGDSREPTKIEGKYQKGQPFFVKSGAFEAYRIEDGTVYREGENAWKRFDPQEMMGFGRRGEGGRDRERERTREPALSREEMLKRFDKDGDGKLSEEERQAAREAMEKERQDRGERGGRGEQGRGEQGRGERGESGRGFDRFGGMRSLFNLSRLTLPHESINKIADKVKNIRREDKEGKVVYTADLTKEGAEALMTAGSPFGRRGRFGGGGGPDFEYSGTVKLTATLEGVIERIEFTTKMKGSFGERTFERGRKTVTELSGYDEVKVEVPEEAMAEFVL